MRKSTVILALSLGALLSVTSCKNGKSTMKQAKQATQEMFDNYKTQLADSVLEQVDILAEQYFENIENGSLAIETVLSKRERLMKPKYLFDPGRVDKMVTMHQKTAALAFLITERPLRIAYDMSTKESDAAIAKLLLDLNYPISMEDITGRSISENARTIYAMCKKKNQVQYFWEVQTDALINVTYLLASNPELYYDRLTDEQVKANFRVLECIMETLDRIALVDKEMARVQADIMQNDLMKSRPDFSNLSAKGMIEFHVKNKEKIVDRRNRLLR